MDNTFNNYISLFNEDNNINLENIDNITIKFNNDNLLYISELDNINKIKVNEQYKLLVSNNIPETILSKLTNDYIEDETIDKVKIYNLTNDLLNILNKFNEYYLKNETYSQSEVNSLISSFVTITFLNNKLTDYYLKTLTYSQTEINILLLNYYLKNETYSQSEVNSLISSFVTITFLNNKLTDYYLKIDTYSKTETNNLLLNYYLKTLTYSQSEVNSLISSFVTITFLNNKLTDYYLKTLTYSQTETNNLLLNYYLKTLTYSQSEVNSLISSFVTITFLNNKLTEYTNTINLNLLLNDKLNTSTYNTDQTNLALKFFSPLSTGNLRKAYLEYADLTNNKYIFFSQNGVNQYQSINFIEDGTLLSSKLETDFYNKVVYCYENWRDIFTGSISLSALNTPGSVGNFYLKASKTALLTLISWDNISNLSTNIILPYQILSSNSGYGSADTCNFLITQQTNRTTSTGAGFTISHFDDINLYRADFGYNSSGRYIYGQVSPNYIQYPHEYGYCFSTGDFYIFSKSSTNNNVSAKIQILNNPDIINFWSSINLKNWNIENSNNVYLTNIYPNTTNAAFVKVNSDLQITGIIKSDYIQGFNSNNLITFNNDTTHNNLNVANCKNIFVSFINSNSNNNSNITFNNNLDINNKLISNYNLEYLKMLKTTSGNISLKTNTNNTFVGWGCIDGTDGGIGMGLYKNASGVSSVYHSVDKDYGFGNSLLTLYTIAYKANMRHEMVMVNIDINMDSNSTIYTNYLRNGTATGVINTYNLKMMTNLNMNGFSLTNFTFPAASINTSNSISVNTAGNNFLTLTNTTKSGVIIYGMTANSFFHENQNGESAGCGGDGGSDNFTIWTAGDGSSICNFQDEDSSNTRLSYINAAGVLVSASTKTRKHSIKEKNNNNVLSRIMKIKISSYGYKYEFNNDDTEKKKQRMINKSKKLNMGVILEDVYEILPNIIDKYDNSLDDNLIDDNNIKDKDITFKNKPKLEEIEDIKNQGIDYNKLNLYHIMAFLLFVKETDEKFNNLNTNNNSVKNNLYINDKLDEYNIRLENIEYNNLKTEDIYRIKNIINTQDDIYKTINNDIKNVKLENEILRDKYIDYVENNVIINNNLKDKVIGLEDEIKLLKEDNIKFKAALKMVLSKLN